MRNRLVLLIAAALVAAADVPAQADIRGTVTDSLRARPLAGAIVMIDGTQRRSRTDARGRYELRDVPAGTHTLVVLSPYLDSMALGAIRASAVVQTRAVELDLTTPTLSQYERAVCGARLPPDQGVLIGTASTTAGDPSAGTHVAAIWNEALLTTTGTAGLVRGSADTTNESGFFALCGVPIDAEFQVRAGDDTLGTAVLTLAASSDHVRRRDLRVGAAERTVRVRGRLVTSGGSPIEGTVEVLGDSTSLVRTGASGAFELTLADRSEQLWLRVIGFTPRTIDMDAGGSEIDLGDVQLDRVPQELEGRLIEGRLVSRERFEFEERRRAGLGVQLDSAVLAKYPSLTVTALATEARLARVVRTGGRTETLMLRKGADVCSPRVYLNGSFIGKSISTRTQPGVDGEFLAQLLREAKRIEMYTAPTAPPGFTDFDGCGVVLIWTR